MVPEFPLGQAGSPLVTRLSRRGVNAEGLESTLQNPPYCVVLRAVDTPSSEARSHFLAHCLEKLLDHSLASGEGEHHPGRPMLGHAVLGAQVQPSFGTLGSNQSVPPNVGAIEARDQSSALQVHLCPVEPLVAKLPDGTIEQLGRADLTVQGVVGPMLFRHSESWLARCPTRANVITAGLDNAQAAAVSELLDAIPGAEQLTVALHPGDLLLWNNTRLLHGFTATEPVNCVVAQSWLKPATGFTTFQDRSVAPPSSEDSLDALEAAVAAQPSNPEALTALASRYNTLERTEEAEPLLARACELSPFRLLRKPVAGKPHVLQLISLRNAGYIESPGPGGVSMQMSGGHFTVNDLLQSAAYNITLHRLYDRPAPEDTPLPQTDVFLNSIACADRMAIPLQAAAEFIDRYPERPVINHPARVARTRREENYQRLKDIAGLTFPATLRVQFNPSQREDTLRSIAQTFDFPIIIRPDDTHTGVGVSLIHTMSELEALAERIDGAQWYYAIEFIDYADDAGHYSKIRCLSIDGQWYPLSRLVHNGWNVHSGDRYAVMQGSTDIQAEEREFLRTFPQSLGDTGLQALNALRNVIGLDFFGVDFNLRPDGSLLVFETNAAMRHSFDHARHFPYTRPHLAAASRAFNTMVWDRATQ